MNLPRYWHTLRHLRPVQIYGRLWHRLHKPRANHAPAPPVTPQQAPWQPPAQRGASLVAPGEFRFLNEQARLADVGWNGRGREKLWRYNQHYFDDLCAEDGDRRSAWHLDLLQDWLAANPPGHGDGWEPYPTSLRIVNWIKWALMGHALPPACAQSLAVQVRWLRQRLEFHLLGNHLFANAKALVFAGLYFSGPEARQWLETGLRILERQIPEQILADGGQFERSTMYHALAYEDMLDLVNVTTTFPEASQPWKSGIRTWRPVVERMGYWLRAMCHPDGEIALFNDAAMGIAPSPAELFGYAARLGCPAPALTTDVVHLAASGYVRLEMGPALLLVDVAPIGPDYLPGHAHADTLSFELSLHGQRVVVNGGTSRYGMGPARDAERGTAAHSTVAIDGQDSSEVWAGFRVARRARPFGLSITRAGEAITVQASHDGYRRLPGRPIHRRTWTLSPGRLDVHDEISGAFSEAVARYHCHPDLQIRPVGRGWQLHWAGRVIEVGSENESARVAAAAWHPRFGVETANCCLEFHLPGSVRRPTGNQMPAGNLVSWRWT